MLAGMILGIIPNKYTVYYIHVIADSTIGDLIVIGYI